MEAAAAQLPSGEPAISAAPLLVGYAATATDGQPRSKGASRSRGSRGIRGSRTRPEARLSVCVLGTGSGGNSTALRVHPTNREQDRGVVLVDLGFVTRTTARRLQQAGLDFTDLRAACVTLLDCDHFGPSWLTVLADLSIRLWVHHWHLPVLAKLPHAGPLFAKGLVETFDRDTFDVLPGGELRAGGCGVQHDRQKRCPTASLTRAALASVTPPISATPRILIPHLAGVDVLCIESNHNPRMTTHCSRPSFVNRRNLSDSGHLSDEQDLEAVRHIAALSPRGIPERIVSCHVLPSGWRPERGLRGCCVASGGRRPSGATQHQAIRWAADLSTLNPHPRLVGQRLVRAVVVVDL